MSSFPAAAIREALSEPRNHDGSISEVITLFGQWKSVSSNMDSVVRSALGMKELLSHYPSDPEASVPPLPGNDKPWNYSPESTPPAIAEQRPSVVAPLASSPGVTESQKAIVLQNVWRGVKARAELSRLKAESAARAAKEAALSRTLLLLGSKSDTQTMASVFASWRLTATEGRFNTEISRLQSQAQVAENLRTDRISSAVGALVSAKSVGIFFAGWRRVGLSQRSDKDRETLLMSEISKREAVVAALVGKGDVSQIRLMFSSWRRFASQEIALKLGQDQHQAIVSLRGALQIAKSSSKNAAIRLVDSMARNSDNGLKIAALRGWLKMIKIEKPAFELEKEKVAKSKMDLGYRGVMAEMLGQRKGDRLISVCFHFWWRDKILSKSTNSTILKKENDRLIDVVDKMFVSLETLAIVWYQTKHLTGVFSNWRTAKNMEISHKKTVKFGQVTTESSSIVGLVDIPKTVEPDDRQDLEKDSVGSMLRKHAREAHKAIKEKDAEKRPVGDEAPWIPKGQGVPDVLDIEFSDAISILNDGQWAEKPFAGVAACAPFMSACGSASGLKVYVGVQSIEDPKKFLVLSDDSNFTKIKTEYPLSDVAKCFWDFDEKSIKLTDLTGKTLLLTNLTDEFLVSLAVVVGELQRKKDNRRRASQRITIKRLSAEIATRPSAKIVPINPDA